MPENEFSISIIKSSRTKKITEVTEVIEIIYLNGYSMFPEITYVSRRYKRFTLCVITVSSRRALCSVSK